MFPVYLTIVIVLAVIFIIVGSLLLIPFAISFRFLAEGTKVEGRFALSWLGFTFLRRNLPRESKKKKTKEEESMSPLRAISKLTSISPDSLGTLFPILDAFRKSIWVEEITGDLTVGLEDPVDTAIVNGCLWSVASAMYAIPKTSFHVYSDFETERLDGYVSGEFRIRVFRIALSLIKAYTKKPFRNLVKAMRS